MSHESFDNSGWDDISPEDALNYEGKLTPEARVADHYDNVFAFRTKIVQLLERHNAFGEYGGWIYYKKLDCVDDKGVETNQEQEIWIGAWHAGQEPDEQVFGDIEYEYDEEEASEEDDGDEGPLVSLMNIRIVLNERVEDANGKKWWMITKDFMIDNEDDCRYHLGLYDPRADFAEEYPDPDDPERTVYTGSPRMLADYNDHIVKIFYADKIPMQGVVEYLDEAGEEQVMTPFGQIFNLEDCAYALNIGKSVLDMIAHERPEMKMQPASDGDAQSN